MERMTEEHSYIRFISSVAVCCCWFTFIFALLKNSPPDCFLPAAQSPSSPVIRLLAKNRFPRKPVFLIYGADDGARTRYLHLGKVALYQMSYIRIFWCLRTESNHRHGDFQSPALPTELQRQKLATRNGLEPSTSSVTG